MNAIECDTQHCVGAFRMETCPDSSIGSTWKREVGGDWFWPFDAYATAFLKRYLSYTCLPKIHNRLTSVLYL